MVLGTSPSRGVWLPMPPLQGSGRLNSSESPPVKVSTPHPIAMRSVLHKIEVLARTLRAF
jgi:hypothetical protein